MLFKDREAYRNNNKCQKTVVQQLQTQIDDLKSLIPNEIDVQSAAQVTQQMNAQNATIHGGKHDKISKKRNNLPNQRYDIATVQSTWHIRAASHIIYEPIANTRAFNKDDTNADTCCLGRNWIITAYSRITADIYAYDKSIKPVENVPIVQAVTAYDCHHTKKMYLLQINEDLYYGNKLDLSLINPNQICAHGIPYWNIKNWKKDL